MGWRAVLAISGVVAAVASLTHVLVVRDAADHGSVVLVDRRGAAGNVAKVAPRASGAFAGTGASRSTEGRLHQPTATLVTRRTPRSSAYFDSLDLEEVVERARSDPASGSYFYATLALHECERTDLLLFGTDAEVENVGGPRRAAALERHRKRCGELGRSPPKLLRRLGDEGVAAGDAGFAFLTPLQSRPTRRDHHDLLSALHDSRDAGVVLWAINDLAAGSDLLRVAGREPTEFEKSSLPAAIWLLSCTLGAPCDDRHPLVQFHCLGFGRCEDDLPTLLRGLDVGQWIVYTRGTRFDWHTAQRLHDEIAAGIARGDRRILVFRDG